MCVLTTVGGEFARIHQCERLRLYFMDIHKLLPGYMPEYVEQTGDVEMSPGACFGGCAGYISRSELMGAVSTVVSPTSSLKQAPAHELTFRVWRKHERMLHTDLTTIVHMVKHELLGEMDVTAEEIIFVPDH